MRLNRLVWKQEAFETFMFGLQDLCTVYRAELRKADAAFADQMAEQRAAEDQASDETQTSWAAALREDQETSEETSDPNIMARKKARRE